MARPKTLAVAVLLLVFSFSGCLTPGQQIHHVELTLLSSTFVDYNRTHPRLFGEIENPTRFYVRMPIVNVEAFHGEEEDPGTYSGVTLRLTIPPGERAPFMTIMDPAASGPESIVAYGDGYNRPPPGTLDLMVVDLALAEDDEGRTLYEWTVMNPGRHHLNGHVSASFYDDSGHLVAVGSTVIRNLAPGDSENVTVAPWPPDAPIASHEVWVDSPPVRD